MSPVELIKVAQQCGSGASAVSAKRVVQTIAWSKSTTATCGLTATLLRDGIPHGVWFVAYDVCKETMMTSLTNNHSTGSSVVVPVPVSLVSGAVAAAVAWAVGYPADLIKTRIQALAMTAATNNTSAKAATTGIVETARQIIREADGKVVSGLYRGFGMKLVRSVPASMIGFTVYEGVKEQILRIERRF
jgi:solute carrier family 25 (mitochondrial carnitine/acylcarnitine transporter), member 20/29